MNLSNFSSDSIDKAVASLTEVLYDNAKKCLHLKDIGLNVAQKGLKIKKWFDKDCETAKKEVLVAGKPFRDIPKNLLCEGSTISSRGTISF